MENPTGSCLGNTDVLRPGWPSSDLGVSTRKIEVCPLSRLASHGVSSIRFLALADRNVPVLFRIFGITRRI